MSHRQQMEFVSSVKERHPSFFAGSRVLEVGSLNINGTIRQFFDGCAYLGVDLGEGPGVDLVCAGHELPLPDVPYDVCCSCECFEHDCHWAATFRRMVELCRPGGLVFFTCATEGRHEHGTARTTPADSPFTNGYYKNLTEADFREAFDFEEAFQSYHFSVGTETKDLYFHGIKR